MNLSLILVFSLSLVQFAFAEVGDSPQSRKENIVILDPVVSDGTPAEALKHDKVVPSIQGKTSSTSANGSISRDLQNTIPFHFNDNGRAGNATNVSGYTKTAEEVDVNVLGIPLNGSQGGGFNLSSFPQYLWSGFNFQIGPALGAYDPRGTLGSLSLHLWTADAVNGGESSSRFTALHSTEGVQQFSIGADYGKTAAANVGWSFDKVTGPSGSFSARILDDGSNTVKFHLLVTNQTVEGFLSERALNPTAAYTNLRYIPILQADRKLGGNVLLKTSWFYDHNTVKTDDPVPYLNGVQYRRGRAKQGGVETALLWGKTKIGFSFRQADYRVATRSWSPNINTLSPSDYSAKTEQYLNTQITQAIDISEHFYLEPTIGGSAVTRFGYYPSASIGARYFLERSPEKTTDLFLRVGSTPRFPSIIDRYPTYAGVTLPNPALKPERVTSVETGLNRVASDYRTSFTLYARQSKDTRDFKGYNFAVNPPIFAQVINNGEAYDYGGLYSFEWKPVPIVTPTLSAHYSKARFSTAKKAVPFNPNWIGIFGVDVHNEADQYGLLINQRLSSNFESINENSNASTRLPGYGYTDMTARYSFFNVVQAQISIQNVFDKKIQFRSGQPTDGREYVFLASGAF